jgi:hypothetical protein
MKDSQPQDSVLLQIRIPRELRDAFIHRARAQDDSASRLVRQWIRAYLLEHPQPDLSEH